jgi:hypothetical protein
MKDPIAILTNLSNGAVDHSTALSTKHHRVMAQQTFPIFQKTVMWLQ